MAIVASVALGVIELTSAAQFAILGVGVIGLVALGLREPQVAVLYLLGAMFLRLALPHVGVDPFVLAFFGVLVSCGLWLSVRPSLLPHFGWLEAFMALYVLWNVISMLAPHRYAAIYPLSGASLSVLRFILTGTAIPFVLYLVGRVIYLSETSVRVILWAIAAFGGYSALVSILQFHAPSLVWPRYIVDAPLWPGRANGVFNQPVVNGLVLIAGFVATLIVVAFPSRSTPWLKPVGALGGLAMIYGVYLTHTRAVWLCFLVVVAAGAIFARGMRLGFLLTLSSMLVAVGLNWSTFTSSDRAAGGIGSTNEIDDRLNSIATSIWAAEREPIFGWGIGRFTAVNSYHHQQWSPDIPWLRGLGISSHFNELGILVELGAIGLILWLCVLALLIRKTTHAMRSLPTEGVCGRNLGLLAVILLGMLMVTGLTVDLRFFDFPNALGFLVMGIAVGFSDRLTELSSRAKPRMVATNV